MGRALGFGLWTAAVVNAHRLCARFDEELETPEGKSAFMHRWSQGIMPLLGVDLRVVGGAPPQELGRSYLVISNHRSPLDIFVCVNLVGGSVLSHHRVESYPVLGDAARYTDAIFVDRTNQRSGAQAIRKIRRRLKARRNVIVFPEGTTFRGDEVRPFKRGSFAAARRLEHVSVLPLGVAYEPGAEFFDETFLNHMARMGARRRTPIWAVIGDPRPVPNTEEDRETLRAYVQTLVDRAAAARDQS